MKNFLKKYWFVISIFCLCAIKQIMVSSLPIFCRDSMGPDQYKLYTDAVDIWNGQYIQNNEYGIFTLFKRAIAFPIFLSLCHHVGISYLAGYTLLYTVACIWALYAILQYVDNRKIALVAFGVLLFCPYSYDYVVQMVYNLSFTAPLAIAAISCLMIAYSKRNEKWYAILVWMLLAGVCLTGIWLNREDSVWILPLIFCFLLVIVISLIRNKEKFGIKGIVIRTLVFVLPLFFVVIGDMTLSYINSVKYGIYTTNDYTATNFESAYNSLLEIDQKDFPEYCAISKEMLERAYEVSPSLAEIKPYMDAMYESGVYDQSTMAPGDGEIENALMNIALRDAASQAGYYRDAVSTNEYWGRVADEIQVAFDEGKLESRNMTFFGSTLHHPWRSNAGYVERWANAVWELLYGDVFHTFASPALTYNLTDSEMTARYEALTLNYSVDNPCYKTKISGWILPCEYTEKFELQLIDENGLVIQKIELLESQDIKISAPDNPLSGKCRFEVKVDTDTQLVACIKVITDTNEQLIACENGKNYEGYNYHFDVLEQDSIADPDEAFATRRVEFAARIANVYPVLGPIMAILFTIGYIYKTYRLVRTISNRQYEYLNEWIFQSAILGCIAVLLVAISYVHAFLWGALFYTHTIGALIEFAGATAIAIDGNIIWKKIKNRRGAQE